MKAAAGQLLSFMAGQVFAFARMNGRAIASYRRCVAFRPDHAQAWRLIGFHMQQALRDAEAIQAFNRALEIEPDHATTRYNLGFLLHRERDLEAALAQMRESTRLQPSLNQAWYGSGLILAALGRHEQSVHALEEAARLQPFHAGASRALCQAYRTLGDEERLLAEYRRIGMTDPQTARRLRDELGLPL